MDYILSGHPKEVEKVIRENRIRINRGVISITPVVPEVATDTIADDSKYIDDIADSKKLPTPAKAKGRGRKTK